MKRIAIGLIGTGVFIHLAFQSLIYPVNQFLLDILLGLELDPFLIFAILKVFNNLCYIIIFILVIKKVKKSNLESLISIRRIFIFSVLAFLATTLLEISQPFISYLYRTPEHYIKEGSYHNSLNENHQFRLKIDSSLWYFRYVIVAFLIYMEINPVLKGKKDIKNN